MNQGWARACLIGLMLFTVSLHAWGQSTPEDEYKKLIKVDQDIHPLGEHPFGEDISLMYGSLSFHVTDVSARGNGPLLSLSRTYNIEGVYDHPNRAANYSFGDWILDLPRIETYSAGGRTYNYSTQSMMPVAAGDWLVDTSTSGGDMHQRCQNFAAPPDMFPALIQDTTLWTADEWWRGYHLIIPGQGSQDLLQNTDSSTQGTYPAVTKNHWRISCISETATANGKQGDGFVAHAPDGTTYYFNELVTRYATSLKKPADPPTAQVDGSKNRALYHVYAEWTQKLVAMLTGSSAARAEWYGSYNGSSLGRADAWMLVTRIEDRFGNTLDFSYNNAGRLTDITASDGRHLTVQYDSSGIRIASVTLQPASGASRTWTYTYADNPNDTGSIQDGMTLTTVTLPDSSKWQYDLKAFDTASTATSTLSSCKNIATDGYDASPHVATIVHPSGLTGVFTVVFKEHGRSKVQRACFNPNTSNATDSDPGSYAFYPDAWYAFTITKRTISGAGIPTRTWQYNYSGPHASWTDTDCSTAYPSTGVCPTTVWTDVVAPDGSTVRRTFSNKYGVTTDGVHESALLSTAFEDSSGNTLRTVTNTYANPTPDATTRPWPATAGNMVGFIFVDKDQLTKYTPLQQRDITQDGDTYTWQAEHYDEYAQVTEEIRSNTIAGQVADHTQTTYYNDTTLWVLGLPLQTDNLTSGVTTNRYVYDISNDMLTARYHFCTNILSDPTVTDDNFSTCNRVMSYTCRTAQAILGPASRMTTRTPQAFPNYMRGIPQTISYPDNTTQSLSVDDLGQISSITDQASNTTSYQYDNVGRVTRIDYPTGDPQSWAPTTFTYDYVTSAERGIDADHWRRTVSTGNARKVTYFDALLQPVLSESYDTADSASHVTSATDYDWRGQSHLRLLSGGRQPRSLGADHRHPHHLRRARPRHRSGPGFRAGHAEQHHGLSLGRTQAGYRPQGQRHHHQLPGVRRAQLQGRDRSAGAGRHHPDHHPQSLRRSRPPSPSPATTRA